MKIGLNERKYQAIPDSLEQSLNNLFFSKKTNRRNLFNWSGKVKTKPLKRKPVTRDHDKVIVAEADPISPNLNFIKSEEYNLERHQCLKNPFNIKNSFTKKTDSAFDFEFYPKGDVTITLLIDMSRSMLDECKVLSAARFSLYAHSVFYSLKLEHQILGFKTTYILDIDEKISKIKKSNLGSYGRKSATVHYVFKDLLDTHWDITRLHLLLKGTAEEDIESNGAIDSEAILWAIKRITTKNDNKTHLVLVLNDGQPNTEVIDDAETLLTNQTKEVIDDLSTNGCLVFGLGVNVDLSGYYDHYYTITDDGDYQKIIKELINILSF